MQQANLYRCRFERRLRYPVSWVKAELRTSEAMYILCSRSFPMSDGIYAGYLCNISHRKDFRRYSQRLFWNTRNGYQRGSVYLAGWSYEVSILSRYIQQPRPTVPSYSDRGNVPSPSRLAVTYSICTWITPSLKSCGTLPLGTL